MTVYNFLVKLSVLVVKRKMNEIEKKRKRLILRSGYRGMKEMDLIMGSFAGAHVSGFSDAQLDVYDALLTQNDPDLYGWITGKEEPPEDVKSDIFDLLSKHVIPTGA